jgi:hypothetical protein
MVAAYMSEHADVRDDPRAAWQRLRATQTTEAVVAGLPAHFLIPSFMRTR